jgi:hypothetical protein
MRAGEEVILPCAETVVIAARAEGGGKGKVGMLWSWLF